MTDLALERQESVAAAFVSGRIDETDLREELGRIVECWEIDYHIDALKAERAKRRRKEAIAIVLFVACVLFLGWTFRGAI